MNYCFENIIKLFKSDATRILVITKRDFDPEQISDATLVKEVHRLDPTEESSFKTLNNLPPEYFDLVIVDRIWDDNRNLKHNSVASNSRFSVLQLLHSKIVTGGMFSRLELNAFNLRNISSSLNCLIGYVTNNKSRTFNFKYINELTRVDFTQVKRFFLLPSIKLYYHVIADTRRSTQVFARRRHRLDSSRPKSIRALLIKIAVWLGIDRYLFTYQLFVAYK